MFLFNIVCIGTKAARKLPEDFPKISKDFRESVRTIITENKIDESMVINWDQTGIN